MGNLVGVKVGDKVYVRDTVNGGRYGDKGSMEEVVKVTKQTVYVAWGMNRTRAFEIESGRIKDNYGHHYAWKSKEEYEVELEEKKCWGDFKSVVNSFWQRPKHLTPARVRALIQELKEPA